MSEVKQVFGIDLGTTYSAIAYVDEHGMPVIVKNVAENNSLTLPSVVYIEDDGSVVVGIEAKKNSVLNPDRTFSEIKRFMGKSDYVPREIDGTPYPPEYVSSLVLKKIAQYASSSLGTPVEDVVITVPAYFTQSQRVATHNAGMIAGFNVLSILNEPTAAAICYGVDSKNNNQTVMVFDLGGGTFDVTIINIIDSDIKVVMTGGDAELGGRRWDQAIVNYVVDQFKSEHGIDLNTDENKVDYQDLWMRCEEAKITLTNRNSTNIMINCGVRMKVEVTRELFDELTSQLCQRTIQLSRDLIERAKMEKNLTGIDAILLVGGSTFMPQIIKAVQDEFGIEPKLFEPNEAVAKGAAIMARKDMLDYEFIRLLKDQGVDSNTATDDQKQKAVEQIAKNNNLPSSHVEKDLKINIVNVLSHSIGIYSKDDNHNDIVSIMLKDQTELPCDTSKQFGTEEANQQNADIKVMENQADITDESNINGWTQLNELGNPLPLPPNLPKNAPVQVQFSVDKNGKLHVFAEDMTGHNRIEFDINIKGVMKEEEVEKKRVASNSLVIS